MILRQYLDTDPAVAASYLVGCGGRGIAAAIDPLPDFDDYARDAEAAGMSIRYVIDTHVHADHVSGGRDLAERTDARYVLHASVAAEFDFRAVDDGDELALGNVSLEIWQTPGHTPEHVSLVVVDQTRAAEPWAVLTGHTLMVGDMGRTELASTGPSPARCAGVGSAETRSLRSVSSAGTIAPSGSRIGRPSSAS